MWLPEKEKPYTNVYPVNSWPDVEFKSPLLYDIHNSSIYHIHLQKCITYGPVLSNENVLMLTDCNKDNTNQRFTFDATKKIIKNDQNQCLEHFILFGTFKACSNENSQKWNVDGYTIRPFLSDSTCLTVATCGKLYFSPCLKKPTEYQFNPYFARNF